MRRVFGVILGCALLFLTGATGCKPSAEAQLDNATSALFTILADETARMAGGKKQVIVVATTGPDGKASETAQSTAAALKKAQLAPEIKMVSIGDPMRMGGYGWSAESYREILQQHPEAGAVVSLVGAPLLKMADLSKVPPTHPPVIAVAVMQVGTRRGVAGSPDMIGQLLERKALQLAIIDGPEAASEAKNATEKQFGQLYARMRAPQ